MSASVTLTTTVLAVDPGSEVRCPCVVRNNGTVVDQFTFEVLGAPAAWATVEPPSVSLFPGAEQTVEVCFRPPRDAGVAAGPTPFGVKVTPRERPMDTVVEEGTVTVGSFADMFSEVIPRSGRGRARGRFELALDDKGNSRINARLSGTDDNNSLRFTFNPPALTSAPGEAAFAKVIVRPKRTFLRGAPRTHQFRVQSSIDGAPPLVASGTFIQDPRIPKWLPKAVLALIAIAAVLVALWFALLRPKIRSEARQAAQQQVQGQIAGQVAAGVAGAVTQLKTGAPPTIVSTTTTVPAAASSSSLGLPPGPVVDGRLVLKSPGTVSFSPPAGKSYQLTDLVLENPHADTGTLTLLRSGTTLMVLELDNFRDLDYHFVSPIVFPTGTQLQLNAACTSPDCTPGMYFDGYTLPKPPGS